MLKATDGLKQAHMDVLVAVPGRRSPSACRSFGLAPFFSLALADG